MSRLDLDSFYDLTEPTDVAVAPDGDRVAFILEEFDPEADERKASLFVVPTDGSQDPHRLTRASQASSPTWSPDGRRLGFLAARETDLAVTVGRDDTADDTADTDNTAETDDAGDAENTADTDNTDETDDAGETDDTDDAGDAENGDETRSDDSADPKPQVWAFDLARGGDAVQLTAFDEGVREFDWGPSGERLVVSARDPTADQREELADRRDGGPIEIDRLQHKANGVGWLDDVTTYLFVTGVENAPADADAASRLDEAYGAGAREPSLGLQPAWGPTDRIAFTSVRTDRPDDTGVSDLYTIDPDGEALRKCTDSRFRTGGYTWSPDGQRLAFAAGDPENWYKPTELHVTAFDPSSAEDDATTADESGLVEHWSVTDSLDRTLAGGSPSWLDDETLLVPIGDEGITRLVRAPADRDDPTRTLPAQGRSRELTSVDAAGGTIAVILSDQTAGEDLYTTDDSDGDALRRVTTLNEALVADTQLPTTRRVTYENDDGESIEAIVHLPPGFDPASDEPRPVIASIHGGPMSYDAPEFRFSYTYWASRGYVVYRPNYRGSVSYGRAHAESLSGTRGTLETDDVVSGLEALADRGWVDPDRSLVTGFSYGGITTANVVTRSDAFAVAAAEHGVYDFRSVFGTDDNHLWHDWEFGLPWEQPELYDQISSITDVDSVETPILLTAGEEDWRCPPTQAEQFYVSVRKRGVPAKLVVYQNEHHDIGDPDRAIHRLETITDWFEKHADVTPPATD